MLSDPASVCLNSTTLSPYTSLTEENKSPNITDETNCNSCVCVNGQPKCSNIWCGLPNCLRKNSSASICELHEVCVPALQETCLSPPCIPRGDCRLLEPSRRVAPPKLPASIDCWPNQAVLGESCARITILLENKRIPQGTSVEGLCHNLRTLVGTKMIKASQETTPPLLIILCDIKTGNNDTVEVTVVSIKSLKCSVIFIYCYLCASLQHLKADKSCPKR